MQWCTPALDVPFTAENLHFRLGLGGDSILQVSLDQGPEDARCPPRIDHGRSRAWLDQRALLRASRLVQIRGVIVFNFHGSVSSCFTGQAAGTLYFTNNLHFSPVQGCSSC